MPRVGQVGELETPAALVDVDRMRANLERTVAYCSRRGIGYRPHTKTHKSSALAAEQIRLGALGLTVATPREAEIAASVARDVLVAYPPVGRGRAERLLSLPEEVTLTVALDSSCALRLLAHEARDRGREVGVLVEVDVGMNRVGVRSRGELLALAREAAELPGVRFRGILIYPGHIRVPMPEQSSQLSALAARVEELRGSLAAEGLSVEIVSGGSTPTLFRSHEVPGVTEVRPGTSIFNDRTTALLDACGWTECAYSVLATVVSTSLPGQVVVDAGSKALAKEEVRAGLPDPSAAGGYGCVLDQPDLRVTALSEEHGVIDVRESAWRLSVGERVRIVPNHVCVSVNLHSRLWQVRGEEVLGWWEVEGRR